MTRKTLLAMSLMATLASGAAVAAMQSDSNTSPPPSGQHMGMQRVDTNGDGYIDRSEAAANPRLAGRFDQMDTDKDGRLSRDEMKAARDMRGGDRGPRGDHGDRGAMSEKLDTNKDGRVSRAEAAADPKFAGRFDEMDANKDGYVDRSDMQARMAQHRDECFGKVDTNRDGKLSRDEFAKMGEACGHDHGGRMGHGKAPMSNDAPMTPPAK